MTPTHSIEGLIARAEQLLTRLEAVLPRPLTAPSPVREIGFVRARLDYRRAVARALAESIRAGLAAALGPAPRRAVVLDPLAEV